MFNTGILPLNLSPLQPYGRKRRGAAHTMHMPPTQLNLSQQVNISSRLDALTLPRASPDRVLQLVFERENGNLDDDSGGVD